MHTRHRIAYRHGVPSIPVITATDRGEGMFSRYAFGLPLLDRHL